MKDYEKIIQLQEERRQLIKQVVDSVESYFATKLNLFTNCEWSKEKIESLGWKEAGFYAAGNELIYQKNDKLIAVARDFRYVSLRGVLRIEWLVDYEQLEDYANGIVFPDFKFDAYY